MQSQVWNSGLLGGPLGCPVQAASGGESGEMMFDVAGEADGTQVRQGLAEREESVD